MQCSRRGAAALPAAARRPLGLGRPVAHLPSACFSLMPRRAALCRCCVQTTVDGEEYYRRLQAFRDELAGMPVAVQARGAPLIFPVPVRRGVAF